VPARNSTVTESHVDTGSEAGPPQPGVAVVFMGGRPLFHAQRLENGELVVGRGDPLKREAGRLGLDDAKVSREHVTLEYDGRAFRVRDAGSRNGTLVGGVRCTAEPSVARSSVVRVGGSLLLLLDDVRPFVGRAVEMKGDLVLGPRMQRVFDTITRSAAADCTLHLTGESGTGKELAARHFHAEAAGAKAPFIPVNCAGIPQGIAERLLFGARRGAYSGADRDAQGYLEAANGGTLFLDEIGELESVVQPKLLRALETREVVPLGATRPVEAAFKLCSATHEDLRAAVGAGDFREDLYFRMGRPSVELPPLRERLEEVPWLLRRALGEVHVSLVEACLLRPWPGNVRELLREAKSAAANAGDALPGAEHLQKDAGQALAVAESDEPPSQEKIEAALQANGGNVSATARALKVHRTQLRRWLKKP
jgi:transcriptional regulator of acetoin/glycerol metabolism